MYTPYLEAIDENSVSIDRDGKVKGEIKHHQNVKISFNGNLKKFVKNPYIYNKIFNKNVCCGVVVATKEQIIESKRAKNPLDIINVDNVDYVDNMIEWKHKDNTIHICNVCGFIESAEIK